MIYRGLGGHFQRLVRDLAHFFSARAVAILNWGQYFMGRGCGTSNNAHGNFQEGLRLHTVFSSSSSFHPSSSQVLRKTLIFPQRVGLTGGLLYICAPLCTRTSDNRRTATDLLLLLAARLNPQKSSNQASRPCECVPERDKREKIFFGTKS